MGNEKYEIVKFIRQNHYEVFFTVSGGIVPISTEEKLKYEIDGTLMVLLNDVMQDFDYWYKNEEEFEKTCIDYFEMIKQYGARQVGENLKSWLSETSAMGSGDDITVLMAYFDNSDETNSEVADCDEG